MSDPTAALILLAAGEDDQRELLQSIVDVARSIFRSRAASVFLHDRATDELVFAAVSGEGEGELVGRRFPSGNGIAGWVLASRQPIVLEDVAADPRFARTVAEGTGFVPRGLMAAPLLHGEDAIGVLQVLDRPARAAFSLGEMDLLGLFATQAAAALAIAGRLRAARAALESGEPGPLGRVAAVVGALDGTERESADRLLAALADLLARR